ncbi:hypothetical protein [uncultured Victivallis sp.]|uniref:hypothetical protein n=1 Tax=uncultured Victivallis sp. TaxID=354118 RepID=UPI0025991E98|nr:hypothetical protein [uncultured Victivallis sp.]
MERGSREVMIDRRMAFLSLHINEQVLIGYFASSRGEVTENRFFQPEWNSNVGEHLPAISEWNSICFASCGK